MIDPLKRNTPDRGGRQPASSTRAGASAVHSPTAGEFAPAGTAHAVSARGNGQAVVRAAWIVRIRYLGQPLQKARDLIRYDLEVLGRCSSAGGISDDASAGAVFPSDHGA